jgi:hypothetical protein
LFCLFYLFFLSYTSTTLPKVNDIVAAVGIRPIFYPTHSLFDLTCHLPLRYPGTRLDAAGAVIEFLTDISSGGIEELIAL